MSKDKCGPSVQLHNSSPDQRPYQWIHLSLLLCDLFVFTLNREALSAGNHGNGLPFSGVVNNVV